MDEEVFNLPVEAEDEFPLTPPDHQAPYDPEATLALSEALPAPSQIAPSPSPSPPPAAAAATATAAPTAPAPRSRHELDVDATMDALLDEMFPSPQQPDDAADPSPPPAHPPSPSPSPTPSPPAPTPPARASFSGQRPVAAAAAAAAASSPIVPAAHPGASKPRPSLAAMLAASAPTANAKSNAANSAKAGSAKTSTGGGSSSSGGAAAAAALSSDGVAQFRSIFPDVSEGRAQQLIEACTGNVNKAIELFLAQGETRDGGTTRPPHSQTSHAAAAAAPAPASSSAAAAAAAASSSSPALPAWSTRAVKRPRSDDQTPSPSPAASPEPEPAAAAPVARFAPSSASAAAGEGAKVKSERKIAPSRAHRHDGASSSAAAAAAAAPSSLPEPAAAAAASSGSSILSRLEEKERAARARPFADGNVREELILADGSVTDDAASGLRAAVPASINSRLREYQRDGIRFLFDCWRKGRGGLLGDDMGLGKSIQTIGLLAALFSMKRMAVDDGHAAAAAAAPAAPARAPSAASVHPVMLIAPATILLQWQQELHDWCPQLQVRIMHGTDKAAVIDLAKACRLHVLITSYETCQSQMNALRNIEWTLAILDECHRLKNPEIKSTLQFRNELPCKIRIGLTGTAIQNHLLEMWCLFDVLLHPGSRVPLTHDVMKALMDERARSLKHFKVYYEKPIKLGQKFGAPLKAIHLKDQRIDELNQWLAGVMLRREKTIIQDQLPKKEDNVVFCRLSDTQIRCYNRLLQSPDIQSILNNEVDPAGIMWRSFPAHYDESLGVYKECKVCPACLVLPAMSWLSKVANHLAMLQLDHRAGDPQEDLYHAQRDGNALAEEVAQDALRRQREGRGCDALEEPAEKRERARQLAMLALGPDAEAIGGLYRGSPGSSLASASTVESCGKLKALRTLLRIWYREKRPRCKVLLFSNSTIALDLLEAMTVKAGYIHRRIDGQTPTKKRAQIVKEFHDNDAIFLLMLSTRAGGVGLNLTCANIVVIFDPNWNPANDLQSQDRTYRIGQVKDVRVYRLISAGCIEEQIYLRQVYKQQMALALLHPEIKQKRFFKGVMKIRRMQGELFGVRNLFDFAPETGFSAKLLRREADLENGYVIKLDALRKIKEKTDRAAAARGAAVAAAAEGSPAIDGSEPAASPPSSAAAAAAGASGEPPRKKPRPAPSACSVIHFEDEGRAPAAGMSVLEAEARDEHDGLVDEYALSFVATDATLLPPDDPLEASQLPVISEEEEADAKAEVDLSVLLRDDDDEDEMMWSDGEGDEKEEEGESSAAAAAGAGAGAASARKSNVGPSSAAVHSALSGSGMIGRHEFQSVTKGSRMEQRISKTANKVFASGSLMLKTMGGNEEFGRAAAAAAARGPRGGGGGGRGGVGGEMRMRGGKSRTATMLVKPASGVSKSPPAAGAAAAAAADAPMHPPSPTAPYSLESLPPSGAAAAAVNDSPPPAPSPPPAAAAAAAAAPASSSSSSSGSRSLLTAKLDKFAAMAARYGFTSPSDFARWLQNKDNCSKTDVNSMIEASRHDSQRNTQGDA